MEISKQQLKQIIKNKPLGTSERAIVEGLVMRGYNLEGMDPMVTSAYRAERQTPQIVAGNQFEQKPKGFWAKARDFAANIVGGKKLAEGAGLALAAPEVQQTLSDTLQSLYKTEGDLMQRIKEKTAKGEDTTRMEAVLKLHKEEIKRAEDSQKDFVDVLPTSRQVIGSAARLAGTAIAAPLAKAVGGAMGVGRATTIGAGAIRGAGAGAVTGGIEGAIQGAGLAAEEDKTTGEIIRGGVAGAATGVAAGALVGAVAGGWQGYKNPDTLQQKTQYITPEADELTPKQYDEALRKGKIKPRTTTQAAQYVFDEDEAKIIAKYSDTIAKDPTRTSINMYEKISDLDKEVGTFLKQNNGIFNKGELRNAISSQMDDIIDITVPEEQLIRAKTKLVESFVDDLDKNDMYSLWQARKAFDRQIESAFRGSPTLQKEVKTALRTSVQEFIKTRTPNSTYANYMDDMSGLIKIKDLTVQKATKQRTRSALQQWIKTNPKKAKAAGWSAAIIGTGFIGTSVLNRSGQSE